MPQSKKKLTLEDYKAPWEIDADGNDLPEDQHQIDPERLKKYLFGLLSDKESAVEARDKAQADLATANEALNAKTRQDESDEQRRAREAQERDTEIETLRTQARRSLALEVALSQDGITKAQAKTLAKVLQGTTEDELDANAKTLIDELGLAKAAGGEDDGDDDDDNPPVGARPRRLRTPGDPAPHTPAVLTLEAELAKIPRPGGQQY